MVSCKMHDNWRERLVYRAAVSSLFCAVSLSSFHRDKESTLDETPTEDVSVGTEELTTAFE